MRNKLKSFLPCLAGGFILMTLWCCGSPTSSSSSTTNTTTTTTTKAVVTTLAGSTTAGFADGTGTAATFYLPIGLTIDSSGTLYVSDAFYGLIRKVTSAGVVTTFAGGGATTTPTTGYFNATGIIAQFYHPMGEAMDSSGNLYVADSGNGVIRKITSTGVVTTFAGGGGSNTLGYLDDTGTAAKFAWPDGLAFDSSGNLYVADKNNNVIRKITSTGVVTTFAGGGGSNTSGYLNDSGTVAKFNRPGCLVFDSSGNLYVSDTENNVIRKITSTGVVTTFAGGGGSNSSGYLDGTGTSAKFYYPYGMVFDSSGNLYVADEMNNVIRKITPAGVVTTLAGGGGSNASGYRDGTGTAALFNDPAGLAIDSSGALYVIDMGNNMIRKIQIK